MNLPAIPEPVRAALGRLPQYPASALFAAALTLCLGERLGTDSVPELAGRTIRLRITDAGVTLHFRAAPRSFIPCRSGPADLTLAATAQDFLALVLRREDPDTLFFSRRLSMEGDTELGLLVKNTLDQLEPGSAFPAPHEILRRIASWRP